MVKTVEQTTPFKEFKKQFPKAYLVHIFSMTKQPLQLGYYDHDSELITTFNVNDGVQKEQSAAFREPNKKAIKPLEITTVIITMDEAEEIAVSIQKQKFPKELIREKILILQNLAMGQVFNITFITQAFKTINIKIDAATKEIKAADMNSLVSF